MNSVLAELPGSEIVTPGLRDLAAGVVSAEALLVSMATGRLNRLGVEVEGVPLDDPEDRLFELLVAEHGDGAYSRYNALRRRLASFLRAVPCVMKS